MCIFVIFRGSFGHFYALTEFSMHFMCKIQIWTTCTCSNAYKLVQKSNLCPWVHVAVPCKKWEWMSNTLPPSLDHKHWDSWFLNPKLVWNSWNLACYHEAASTCRGKKYCPIWGRFGDMLLTNQSSHNKPNGFGREHPTFGDETISIASYCFQIIFLCQHRITGVLCYFFSFGHFYALSAFWTHLCA